MKKNKLVVVDTVGSLRELGGISGPIVSPTRIDVDVLQKMVLNQKIVYEVNPYNKNDRVLLTLGNVTRVNFKAPEKTVPTKTVVVKATAPELPATIEVVEDKKEDNNDKKSKHDFSKKK